MKKYSAFILIFLLNGLSAQYITLSKAIKTSDSKDRFFYRIDPATADAEYLGEVEVQGFSNNDAEVFRQIYTKAKTIGANSFSLRKSENLDGQITFNPAHYFLNLYYTADIPREENLIYVISSASKPQNIKFNNKTVTLQPRTYVRHPLTEGLSLSVGRLLGSRITLSPKENQPEQYFQVVPAGIRADQSGPGGLNLKSGDIILLEKSYAEFLTTIYQEHQ